MYDVFRCNSEWNVKTSERNIERQVQNWALLGPFLTLFTLFVILVRISPEDLLLPVSALVGVLVCWKWKLKGLAFSLGTLAAIILYQYPDIPVEDRFWQVGLGMALALGFVVTALSFEEVEEIVRGIHEESTNRLQHLWRLDEKLKNTQNSRKEIEDDLRRRLDLVQKDYAENRQLLRSYERLISIARQEILESQQEIEKLKKENCSFRSQNAILEENRDEADACAEEALKQLREFVKPKKTNTYIDEGLTEELMERIELLTKKNELLEETVQKIS